MKRNELNAITNYVPPAGDEANVVPAATPVLDANAATAITTSLLQLTRSSFWICLKFNASFSPGILVAYA